MIANLLTASPVREADRSKCFDGCELGTNVANDLFMTNMRTDQQKAHSLHVHKTLQVGVVGICMVLEQIPIIALSTLAGYMGRFCPYRFGAC